MSDSGSCLQSIFSGIPVSYCVFDFQCHSRHLLQAKIEEGVELNGEQSQTIVKASAQKASLQRKCNIFKEKVKSLNEKNKAWEESYKAQSQDLVLHGMEISRLNGQVSELKRVMLSSEQGSDPFLNRELSLQTPQGRANYRGHPDTM